MFTFSHRLVHNTPCWWCCKSSFFLIWICICNTVSTQYTKTEVFFLLWHFWNSLTRICPRCFLNTFTSLHSLTRLKHFEICKLGSFTGQNRLGCSLIWFRTSKCTRVRNLVLLSQSEHYIALAPLLVWYLHLHCSMQYIYPTYVGATRVYSDFLSHSRWTHWLQLSHFNQLHCTFSSSVS